MQTGHQAADALLRRAMLARCRCLGDAATPWSGRRGAAIPVLLLAWQPWSSASLLAQPDGTVRELSAAFQLPMAQSTLARILLFGPAHPVEPPLPAGPPPVALHIVQHKRPISRANCRRCDSRRGHQICAYTWELGVYLLCAAIMKHSAHRLVSGVGVRRLMVLQCACLYPGIGRRCTCSRACHLAGDPELVYYLF